MGERASFYSWLQVRLWATLAKEDLTYSGETQLLLLFQSAISASTTGPLLVGRWDREDLLIYGPAEWTIKL